MHADVVFSNDPMVDAFFRQIRIYDANKKDDTIHYKGVSVVFEELLDGESEPSYDLYVESGMLYAERNDFQET